MDTQKSEVSVQFRKPKLEDGLAIYHLIQASPPLDVNSSYLYFLQASHFADTCAVAEVDGQIVGLFPLITDRIGWCPVCLAGGHLRYDARPGHGQTFVDGFA